MYQETSVFYVGKTKQHPRKIATPIVGDGYNGMKIVYLMKKFKGVCQLCNKKVSWDDTDNLPNVDHIIPISKGGAWWKWDNMQLTHSRCNVSKGNRIER